MASPTIPVTIITGFLGSGKTTLLNNIIKKYSDTRFAVIENEFGEIGIDSQLISGRLDGIFELANGCICCSLNDDFYITLSKLMDSDYSFDALIVETTGIADPLSVVRIFLSNAEIQQQFRIDSVICMADVTILEELIEEMPEIRRQIAVSDIILLNKADLISKVYIDEAVSILKDSNPSAEIHTTAWADISQIQILGKECYSAHSVEKSVKVMFPLTTHPSQKSMFGPKKSHHHVTDFVSEAFIIDKPLDLEKFALWMKSFLFFNERIVLRAKGIVWFNNHTEKYIFHAVFGSYILEKGEEWHTDQPQTKLVFIGRHLDREQIEEGLNSLL
jgi:G3E family GTPase